MIDRLPLEIEEAFAATDLGATGVSCLVIDGLLKLCNDTAALARTTALVEGVLTGYASIWHISRAAHEPRPAAALQSLRAELTRAAEKTVDAAVGCQEFQAARIRTAPNSGIVRRILARLGPTPADGAVLGLAGADAIGPTSMLNVVGTAWLAAEVPVTIVTTAIKLVPQEAFAPLGAAAFEEVPLSRFSGVILDGEFLTPGQAGERAAALAPA
jgi:hypothetical protein